MTPELPGILIVLGSPNDPDGRLSSIAVERLRCARSELESRPRHRVLLTGGFGAHFNQSALPHAEHARRFLVSEGVSSAVFVEFALSRNTIEDATRARPIVERLDPGCLVVVTSDFHLPRARFIFDRTFRELPRCYIGAPHSCSDEVREQLATHETRALAGLRDSGELGDSRG